MPCVFWLVTETCEVVEVLTALVPAGYSIATLNTTVIPMTIRSAGYLPFAGNGSDNFLYEGYGTGIGL
jgi:hypothetical protein